MNKKLPEFIPQEDTQTVILDSSELSQIAFDTDSISSNFV